jgi:Flp pilus assembly protein TadG
MRHSARRLLRWLGDTEGANMIEAAIITPLLLLVTFAITDFGAMLYVHGALQNGVSQASRYGVTGQAMGGMTRQQSIMAAMRDHTPTLTLPDEAFTFSHLPPGGTNWVNGPGGPNDVEKVTIDYTWELMTPVLRPFFPGGQINFRVESAMKNEGVFP